MIEVIRLCPELFRAQKAVTAMKLSKKYLVMPLLAGLLFCSSLLANDTIIIKAVGTWGYFTNYQKHEGPFWNQHMASVSDGQIIGEIKPQTELGLRGYEIMRLVKNGVFDFAFGLPGYVVPESEIFEGADLSFAGPEYCRSETGSGCVFSNVGACFRGKIQCQTDDAVSLSQPDDLV